MKHWKRHGASLQSQSDGVLFPVPLFLTNIWLPMNAPASKCVTDSLAPMCTMLLKGEQNIYIQREGGERDRERDTHRERVSHFLLSTFSK